MKNRSILVELLFLINFIFSLCDYIQYCNLQLSISCSKHFLSFIIHYKPRKKGNDTNKQIVYQNVSNSYKYAIAQNRTNFAVRCGRMLSENRVNLQTHQPRKLLRFALSLLFVYRLEVFFAQHETVTQVFLTYNLITSQLFRITLKQYLTLE